MAAAGQVSSPSTTAFLETIDVDLVVRDIPRGPIPVETQFNIAFTLKAMASVPPAKYRSIAIAVQHVQLPLNGSHVPSAQPNVSVTSPRSIVAGSSPALPQLFSWQSQTVLDDRTLVGSPLISLADGDGGAEPTRGAVSLLPHPVPQPGDEERYAKSDGARHLGPSALFLPACRLTLPALQREDDDEAQSRDSRPLKAETSWDFEFTYLPVRTGFSTVGGLRVLLVDDRIEDDGDDARRRTVPTRMLREWDVVGEIWVSS